MGFWLLIPVVIVIFFLFINKRKSADWRIPAQSLTDINRFSDSAALVEKGKTVNKTDSDISRTDDDDELTTFTLGDWRLIPYQAIESPPQKDDHVLTPDNWRLIPYQAIESPSQKVESVKRTKNARWIKPGEICVVQNNVITGGNFYYGGELKHASSFGYYDDDSNDASLLNDLLPITPASRNYQDESLGYWPRFSALSPACRGAYLNWLATDRTDSSCPIGYVFIYFYGLERRILIDGKQGLVNDDEFKAIFEEVRRLGDVFWENYSFRNYSARLIDVMLVIRPETVSLAPESGLPLTNESLFFRYQLANTVNKGSPVSAEMALAWIRYYPLYTLRTPARRCEAEFAALFKQRYVEKLGAGLLVKPNKTRLKLEYSPASSTIIEARLDQPDLPDPSMLKTPVQKLMNIAEDSTDALEGYSRYLGKKNTSASDVAAVILLPDEILSDSATEMITHFKIWADECIENQEGLAALEEFWTCLGLPAPAKINKKESDLILGFVHKAGYGIAPDTRYHHAKPEPDGHIVLFPVPSREALVPSAGFAAVVLALQLGAQMAQIDAGVDTCERELLLRIIVNNRSLSAAEKRSLRAYLVWRLDSPTSSAGLKTRLEQLSTQEKLDIAEVIVSVACADGRIAPVEIKQLEKIYAYLGLESSTVTSNIHRFSVAVKKVPASPSADTPGKGFSLDENLLARHESETKDARNLLSTIFIDNETGEQEEKDAVDIKPAIPQLDEAHHQLYQHLQKQETWARDDVTQLCDRLGLMLSGAIETINDWSYERVDAPVLDDDVEIYVDMEIVQELEG
ncbi:ATPase (plasmid) [Enterobacteriaceae bacterium Kacie_13]|nr:ATPase [Enterobacteriaceae bacterium Kacie_13]